MYVVFVFMSETWFDIKNMLIVCSERFDLSESITYHVKWIKNHFQNCWSSNLSSHSSTFILYRCRTRFKCIDQSSRHKIERVFPSNFNTHIFQSATLMARHPMRTQKGLLFKRHQRISCIEHAPNVKYI